MWSHDEALMQRKWERRSEARRGIWRSHKRFLNELMSESIRPRIPGVVYLGESTVLGAALEPVAVRSEYCLRHLHLT